MNIKCPDCGWLGKPDDALMEEHPFKKAPNSITGCPDCLEAVNFLRVCEIKDCDFSAMHKVKTNHGDSWLCVKHYLEHRNKKFNDSAR